jgi:hypothetical protein
MSNKLRLVLFLVIALPLACGCSGKSQGLAASVSGKITYQNKAVPGGMIAFYTSDGQLSGSAVIQKDGSYEATQIAEGKLGVVIETESVNPAKRGRSYGSPRGNQGKAVGPDGQKPPKDGGSPVPEGSNVVVGEYRKIPIKYSNPVKPVLHVELSSGSNSKDFVLTDKD